MTNGAFDTFASTILTFENSFPPRLPSNYRALPPPALPPPLPPSLPPPSSTTVGGPSSPLPPSVSPSPPGAGMTAAATRVAAEPSRFTPPPHPCFLFPSFRSRSFSVFLPGWRRLGERRRYSVVFAGLRAPTRLGWIWAFFQHRSATISVERPMLSTARRPKLHPATRARPSRACIRLGLGVWESLAARASSA